MSTRRLLSTTRIAPELMQKIEGFHADVINEWITWKEDNEIKPSRLRPTALEFSLYYDN